MQVAEEILTNFFEKFVHASGSWEPDELHSPLACEAALRVCTRAVSLLLLLLRIYYCPGHLRQRPIAVRMQVPASPLEPGLARNPSELPPCLSPSDAYANLKATAAAGASGRPAQPSAWASVASPRGVAAAGSPGASVGRMPVQTVVGCGAGHPRPVLQGLVGGLEKAPKQLSAGEG